MDLKKLSWRDHPKNPLIKPPFPEWIIADPSVLSPEVSPDGKWHLFAHGILGIYHYHSYDGFRWKLAQSRIRYFAVRPFIFAEKKKFYLFYEKLISPFSFPFYNSRLEVIESRDLIHWSAPRVVLSPSLPWHKTKNLTGNLGNPSIVKTKKGYRLYFSAGLVKPPDSHFCEPAHQGIAVARNITGPYTISEKPLTKKHPRARRYGSATRVFTRHGLFWGLQTLINLNHRGKQSTASLHLSFSTDGLSWARGKLIIAPGEHWKRTHVYVGSLLKKFNGKFRIYYNARNGSGLFRRESIGLAVSKS